MLIEIKFVLLQKNRKYCFPVFCMFVCFVFFAEAELFNNSFARLSASYKSEVASACVENKVVPVLVIKSES